MQPFYTALVLDVDNRAAYHFGMSKKPSAVTPLRRVRESLGMKQHELAKASGTSQPQIRRLEAGFREMTGLWALRLAPALQDRIIPEDLVFGDLTCHIVGYVGAASEMHYHADAGGYFGLARRPRGATAQTVAVEVRGDSMGPAMDGWVLYYDQRRDPPTSDLIKRVCVLGLSTGQVLVKRLMRSAIPGHFDLWPFAPGDPIQDQQVLWAAKVIAIVPPEEAKVEESQDIEPVAVTPKKRKKTPSGKAIAKRRRTTR